MVLAVALSHDMCTWSRVCINRSFCTLQAHRPDGSLATAEYTLHAKKQTQNNIAHLITAYIFDLNLFYLCDWLLILDIDLRTHAKENIHDTGHYFQIYTNIHLCWYQMMADSTMTTARRTSTAAMATPATTGQADVH